MSSKKSAKGWDDRFYSSIQKLMKPQTASHSKETPSESLLMQEASTPQSSSWDTKLHILYAPNAKTKAFEEWCENLRKGSD